MIVPILFGIEQNPIHYSWIFYKYMDFALKENSPVIAEEAYFEKPSVYEEQREFSFLDIKNNYNYKYEFSKPTDSKMKKLMKIPITTAEKDKILSFKGTREDSIISLLREKNDYFEEVIGEKIDSVIKEYGKIDAIITWTWYKSLEDICKERNITLILLEQTTFRPNNYDYKLSYFQFYDKYDSKQLDLNYEQFKKEKDKLIGIFNRKELLALLLSKEKLDIIKYLNQEPHYEFGINIGPDNDYLCLGNCHIKDDQVLELIEKICPKSRFALGIHPMKKNKDLYNNKYIVEKSPSSIEWILKSKRIVSIGSNISFEAMLLGRTAYILGDNFPYQLGGINKLELMEEKVCDNDYLNYIIFAYYTPYSLMLDKDYIKWRLKKPSLSEIYNYHLNYLLKKRKLDSTIFKLDPKDRIKKILVNSRKIGLEKYKDIINYPLCPYEEEMKKLNELNKKLYEDLQNSKRQYNEIINSKSWKYTKVFRDIIRKFKKNN